MSLTRILVFAAAAVASLFAAFMVLGSKPKPKQAESAAIETYRVLVAKENIEMGATIGASAIGWVDWPKAAANPEFITTTGAADSKSDVAGSIARAALKSGEPITKEKFARKGGGGAMAVVLEPGERAVDIVVRAEGTSPDFVHPGDRVDVIFVSEDADRSDAGKGNGMPKLRTILENVRVLAVDQSMASTGEEAIKKPETLTLALNAAQAETVALAQELGHLKVSLRALVDTNAEPGKGRPSNGLMADRRSMVSTIRVHAFGDTKDVNAAGSK